MATDIYSMLTGGYDPRAEQMKQQQAFQQQLGQSTTPQSFIATVGSNMGNMLGQGVQKIAGVKDPREEKAIKKRQALERVKARGVDTKDRAAFLNAVAQEFEAVGLTAEALQASEAASKLKTTDNSISLLKDFTAESVAKYKETKDVKDLVRYSKEDKEKISTYGQQLVDQGLTPGTKPFNDAMKAFNEADLAGKAPKPEAKSAFEKQMDLAGITDPAKRQAMATRQLELSLKANQGDPTALATLNLMSKQLDIQIAQQKIAKGDKEVSDAAAAQTRKNKADAFKAAGIINTIDTALSQVGGSTAGLGGVIMKKLAGSEAVDLEANLETIQANLGFDQLQAMRDASPTGGALGQVSERELIALQSTVASLKQEQSPDQLRANIEKIKKHYQNWLDTLNGINPDERDAAAAKAKAKRVVPNAEDSALVNKYLKVK
jgi:hypothetical protein